jgi:antitoxin component of RelBE/YafQ-DinJ toxin-antitoxin module
MKKTYQIRIDDNLLDKAMEVAESKGITLPEMIRAFFVQEIEKYEAKKIAQNEKKNKD